MAKLDLEWLSIFDEVFKTANVSKAAERLGIPQAQASTALNKLRVHFDDQLFSRTARGMVPTPYAQIIHPSIREVISQLEIAHANRREFVPAEAERNFRIGMTDISELLLLPLLLNHLKKVAPKVQIEIERISNDSVRRLQDGEVDLAVGFMPQLDAGFYQQLLFEQGFVCLVSRDHPRIGAKLTKAAFAREGHLLVTASGTGHVIVDKVLSNMGVERRVMLRVPSFSGVARVVAATELIATVPARYGDLMATRQRLRVFPLPYPVPLYQDKQHWHERFHTDAGNIWLRRTVAELFSG